MSRTARTIVLAIVIILLLVAVAGVVVFMPLVFARVGMFGFRSFGPGAFRYFAFPAIGRLAMIVIGGLVIGGIVWLVFGRAAGRPSSQPSQIVAPTETPLDILKRRYAAGEITKEQFDQMKIDLGV